MLLKNNQSSLEEIIAKNSSDISPVRDDSPYFYKVNRGVPNDFMNLLIAVSVAAVLAVLIPLMKLKSKSKKNKKDKEKENVLFPLFIFISIGVGFMILEISLFQKFILFPRFTDNCFIYPTCFFIGWNGNRKLFRWENLFT